MSQPGELDSVTVRLGELSISITRSPRRRSSEASGSAVVAPESESSFTVITESPSLQGALDRPVEGTSTADPSTLRVLVDPGDPFISDAEPWTWEWESALLAARTPIEFERICLVPVQGLAGRLRSAGGGWSPLARLGRALRAGLIARGRLEHRTASHPAGADLPLDNRIYVIIRPRPDREPGWTDHYQTYLEEVRGATTRFHGDVISHAFPSRSEAEAYCVGAGVAWPALLQRRR